MRLLGRSGLVIRGHDGLDKGTTTTNSDVWIVRPSGIRKFVLDPRALGLMPATLSDLRGGSAAENAERARALLRGQAGPLRDIVLLNAAAVITAGTLTIDHPYVQLAEAIDRAAEAIDSGSAGACLGTG